MLERTGSLILDRLLYLFTVPFLVLTLLASNLPVAASRVQLEQPVTTESTVIAYTARNGFGLYYDLYYAALEKEEDGAWVHVPRLQEAWSDIGYPKMPQASFKKRIQSIDLIQVFGKPLELGHYRLSVQYTYEDARFSGSVCFFVTQAP